MWGSHNKKEKTPENGSERRVGGGSKGYMQKPNGSKPKGTHNTRVEAQATLSVRRRRAVGRCGAPKINSKRYDAKK